MLIDVTEDSTNLFFFPGLLDSVRSASTIPLVYRRPVFEKL